MSRSILATADARVCATAFSRKRLAVHLRRNWRAWCDRQARQATAVMLYALGDRTLADLGIGRNEIESLVGGLTPSSR